MGRPRVWTDEEVRTMLLDHFAVMTRYWAGGPGSNVPTDYTTEQRMTGLMHSVCSALDGCSVGIPGFVVSPQPHLDDEAFNRGEGENWYPSGPDHDIAGTLRYGWHDACLRAGLRGEAWPDPGNLAAQRDQVIDELTRIAKANETNDRESPRYSVGFNAQRAADLLHSNWCTVLRPPALPDNGECQ